MENRDSSASTGVFNITAIPPLELTRGVARQAVSVLNVNQQFFYRPTATNAYVNRVFRIIVSVLTGTVTPFVNVRNAAGPTASCLGNIRTGTATSSGNSITIEIPTCPAITDMMWIGVVTSTQTSSYNVSIDEINTLLESANPAIPIQVGIPFQIVNPAASTNIDFNFTNTLGPFSWLRINVDNITIGSTYTITHTRDGICDFRGNTFCGETSSFGYKCSTVIGGCQLQTNTLNHIIVAGPATTYTIFVEIMNFGPGAGNIPIVDTNYPRVTGTQGPGEVLRTNFTSSIRPHDIALFRVQIPPREVLPGEDFQLFLDSVCFFFPGGFLLYFFCCSLSPSCAFSYALFRLLVDKLKSTDILVDNLDLSVLMRT